MHDAGDRIKIVLALHAHLPYIRIPQENFPMQELWLFQALTETYIPLIQCFNELIEKNINFNITLSISPTLIYMLTDQYYKDKYIKYIKTAIQILEKKSSEASEKDRKESLLSLLKRMKNIFSYYTGKNGGIINELLRLKQTGRINLITCAATHAVLPLFRSSDNIIYNQIEIAQKTFENTFGFIPEGFWLPEMGYYSGLDKILKEFNIDYTFLEAHSVYLGHKRPSYGSYYPSITDSGLIVLPRDLPLSNAVWSSESGYPGDFDYREFHFDYTYSLTDSELAEFGIDRIPFGLKIYRVTGKDVYKEYYNKEKTKKILESHSEDFINKILNRAFITRNHINRMPVFTLPFDAELFGHWWYEGPDFLKNVIIKITNSEKIDLVSPADFINDKLDCITPAESSWGNGGFFRQWTNPGCSWIYPELAKLNIRLQQLPDTDIDARRQAFACGQALKEILLASSSDWTFFIANNTSVDYGETRLYDHVNSAIKIISDIENNKPDIEFIQNRKNTFPVFNDILL